MNCYQSEGDFNENDQDVLSRGFDSHSGAEVVLISCPPEAIGGDGPVFDYMDKKTVYVLISDKYIEEVMQSASSERGAAIQYGMLVGDVMRRGVYYAQNLNRKKRRKKSE